MEDESLQELLEIESALDDLAKQGIKAGNNESEMDKNNTELPKMKNTQQNQQIKIELSENAPTEVSLDF